MHLVTCRYINCSAEINRGSCGSRATESILFVHGPHASTSVEYLNLRPDWVVTYSSALYACCKRGERLERASDHFYLLKLDARSVDSKLQDLLRVSVDVDHRISNNRFHVQLFGLLLYRVQAVNYNMPTNAVTADGPSTATALTGRQSQSVTIQCAPRPIWHILSQTLALDTASIAANGQKTHEMQQRRQL